MSIDRIVLVGFLLLASSHNALAQSANSGALSVPRCDQLIDATYDQLSNAEKAAKLTSYGGCRKSKADQHLRRRYQAARSELRQWEGNAKIQAREQIREHASTATNIMTAGHKVEREAHQQDFDSRIASLKLHSDAMSTSEVMAERAAINEERGAEFKALQDAQKEEAADLADEIKDSYVIADREIGELAQTEEQSLYQQYEEKAKYIEDEYKNTIDGPVTETPNEAAARNGPVMADEEPIGELDEVEGSVNIIRTDGKEEEGRIGLKIYQGDIVETDDEGAANIRFIDETEFAVSENARLSIDEYVFDPETEGGTRNFNILKGVFLFTSGLIGRDDPDDVTIDTPVGSIGIRG